jgi:hypothetical protein
VFPVQRHVMERVDVNMQQEIWHLKHIIDHPIDVILQAKFRKK